MKRIPEKSSENCCENYSAVKVIDGSTVYLLLEILKLSRKTDTKAHTLTEEEHTFTQNQEENGGGLKVTSYRAAAAAAIAAAE